MDNNEINIEEKDLVNKCVAFERQYQEILYRKYADKMFNICLTYTDDRDEAADILQDGFIKIFRGIKQFNFEGSLEGWVRKIIVNTALEHYRKKISENKKILSYSEANGYIAENILNKIEEQDVVNLVNGLPNKAQMVLKLFAIEGYSHREIAEMMDISEGTSKSQLNRARVLLKQAVKNLYNVF